MAATKTLPHLVWHDEEWKAKNHQDSPLVSIRYKLDWDGYVVAGFPPLIQKVKVKQSGALVATARAMADTGCSSMVAGPEFYKNLGLVKEDLIPVKTVVKAANRTVIDIIGAVIVNI